MEITLNVLRCPDHAVPETRTSSGADITIGRDTARADWVLPDRDMVVSKRHCVIEFRGGHWQVRDLSTNGTFRNHAAEPIGPDAPAPLFDGDRLRVGGWEFEIRLPPSRDAPLRDDRGGAPAEEGWAPMADPFADLAAPSSPPYAPPPHSPPAYAKPQAGPIIPTVPGRDYLHDPLAPPPPPRPAFNQPLLPDDFDPFADDAVSQAPMPDHGPAAMDAFTPPRARPDPSMAAAIPDDWDLLSPPPPAAVPPAAPRAAPPQPPYADPPQAPFTAPPQAPFAAPPQASPFAPPQAAPVPSPQALPEPAATPRPAPDPFADPFAPAPDPAAATPFAVPAAAPAPFVTAAPPSAPPVPAAPAPPAADPFAEDGFSYTPSPPPAPFQALAAPAAPASPGVPDDALAAFLQGAGLPAHALPPGTDPAATLRAAGEGFRAAIAGLRALLIARADVKREFRIEQTMLRARDNNPVKFAPTDEAAVLALIGARDRRGLDGLEETVTDLKAHQIATTAATQTAAQALLDRLAPAGLEAADPGGGLLPGARERRLWEAYRALHKQVVEQFEDDFDSAFGKAFARAYEAASRRDGT